MGALRRRRKKWKKVNGSSPSEKRHEKNAIRTQKKQALRGCVEVKRNGGRKERTLSDFNKKKKIVTQRAALSKNLSLSLGRNASNWLLLLASIQRRSSLT